MKLEIQNDVYGKIVYEEGFWSGKKTITINGTPLIKLNKKSYLYKVNDESITVGLKGSFLTGVSMTVGDEQIQLVTKPEWYVIALSIAMFVFVMTWGNSVTLCKIFPIVSGAIGGLISAACAMANIIFAKKTSKAIFKILIGLAFFAVTLIVCHVIALIFIEMASSLL